MHSDLCVSSLLHAGAMLLLQTTDPASAAFVAAVSGDHSCLALWPISPSYCPALTGSSSGCSSPISAAVILLSQMSPKQTHSSTVRMVQPHHSF